MEDKSLVFAIDVDGVLRDNLGIMVNLYNRAFNDKKTINDIQDFKTDISFPKIAELTGITSSQWFFQEHSQEIFVDAKPYPYVKEDIDYLRTIGKVVIVTYQKSFLNKSQTIKWLEENGIEADGICFLRDKTLVHADYFIDDNNWNFIGCNCKNGILVDAPYNKDVDLAELKNKSNCDSLIKVSSLHDFVEQFKNNHLNGN